MNSTIPSATRANKGLRLAHVLQLKQSLCVCCISLSRWIASEHDIYLSNLSGSTDIPLFADQGTRITHLSITLLDPSSTQSLSRLSFSVPILQMPSEEEAYEALQERLKELQDEFPKLDELDDTVTQGGEFTEGWCRARKNQYDDLVSKPKVNEHGGQISPISTVKDGRDCRP